MLDLQESCREFALKTLQPGVVDDSLNFDSDVAAVFENGDGTREEGIVIRGHDGLF